MNEEKYKELQSSIEKREKNSSRSTLVVIAVILGLFGLFLFISKEKVGETLTRQEQVIKEKEQELILKDSSINEITEQTNTTLEIIKNDSSISNSLKMQIEQTEKSINILGKNHKHKAKQVVIDFFRYSNMKNIDSVVSVLADTLERYYLKENVTKRSIKNGKRSYWEKYPEALYTFDKSKVVVTEIGAGNYEVIVKGLYSRKPGHQMDVLSTIKVNKQYKIYFTRDYLPG